MIIRSAIAVLIKDLRCEFRTRHALSAVLLFAITSTVAVSFTLGANGASNAVSATLLWVVIYFSAMAGLGRSFTHEEETKTLYTLRLASPAESVYLGKLTFNFLMLIVLELVTVPLFVVLMDCHIARMGMFIALLFLGSLALSAGATIAAAMISRAASKGALFAAISFPLLAPALGIAISGTHTAMASPVGMSAVPDIRLLIYYCGIVIIASLMLFRYIWEN